MTLRLVPALVGVASLLAAGGALASPLRIEAVITPQAAGAGPLTGRLLVAISRKAGEEPRFQVDESFSSQQIFGVDVRGATGRTLVIDATANGFPVERLRELPAGDYTVQAVFNRYDTFRRADGRVLELPADQGEGQHWNRKPGNPLSAPVQLHLAPGGGTVRITLDRTIPDVKPPPPDTAFLKHVRVRNERLSRFWGRDVFLEASVLLPQGWAEHPDARYPLVLAHDHFAAEFRAGGPWRETPPGPELKGRELAQARAGWSNYNDWTSGRLPRVILVQVNHANPFYDDSYAVNSANIGPYGDAIVLDLIPELERRFRGIGQGWARALYGGSTGGWETLADQIFYPDSFNGAWSFCPDSVDFHAYQAANLYDYENAYRRQGPFGSIAVSADRSSDTELSADMEGVNRFERAIGGRGRSAEQFDAWQAVYSPVGADGYPAAVYDKATGRIDKAVVAYWRDHYDLNFILKRDWATLGPKLEGKLHVAVGDDDTYFLNNAVHLMDAELSRTQAPHSDAVFDYGPRAPHCYTGAVPDWAKASHVGENARILPQMVERMLATAPEGADVTSWRY